MIGDDRLAFVMLEKDGTELMFQTLENLKERHRKVASRVGSNKAMLYLEVEDPSAILGALDGLEALVPLYTTFSGAEEISIVEPGGQSIIFGQPKAGDSSIGPSAGTAGLNDRLLARAARCGSAGLRPPRGDVEWRMRSAESQLCDLRVPRRGTFNDGTSWA
ncbi:MAG: hypothetical protein R3245_12940 [Kiloniellales bacterium]|nr:hypothetical protein [Kiloniellales bacterium]